MQKESYGEKQALSEFRLLGRAAQEVQVGVWFTSG
jgi:hypothetical protein